MGLTIEVTHANLKTSVSIVKSAVFAVYESGASKSTHIVSIGGSFLPVMETKQQVTEALKAEVNNSNNIKKVSKTNVRKQRKNKRPNDSVPKHHGEQEL